MRIVLLSLSLAVIGAVAAGCGDDSACSSGHCADASLDARRDARADGALDATDQHAQDVLSIQINPGSAMLTASDATPHPTQAFTVVGQRRDGTMTGALPGLWSLSTDALGTIDSATGTFTASGEVGGAARVRVDVVSNGVGLHAEADLSVLVRREITVGGAPADASSRFDVPPTTDPAQAATLVYPLDGAVMPQNVYPADVQWLNGAAGDLFRVRLQRTHVDVVAYVLHTGAAFHNDWLVDAAAWRALALSDVDAPVTITVDRWVASSSAVVSSPSVSMRFANGSVSGAVYYWDIAAGRAVRIDDGTAARSTPIQTPPTSTDDASNCLGCHAVSRDGRYFAGRLGGGANNLGVVFDLTADLSGNPAMTLFAPNGGDRWSYASFSPDSTRLIVDPTPTTGPVLQVIDPHSGAVVPPAGGALPAGTQPSWSPDGHSIAFVNNIDTAWGGEFHSSTLSVLPVTAADTYGAPRQLHAGSALASQPETGAADSYPSWSPDSHWIAFSHGEISRSDTGHGALYLIDAVNGGDPVRLNNAVGGASTTDNFFPNFSPFDSGGYFWLSFLSRRDYGNAQAGTRGAQRQQVWVTAVHRAPDGRLDPSEVAYWLPGQNTGSQNISAFWAPRPCRQDSNDCSVDSECCSGMCRDDGTGHHTCSPPPMDQCRMRDQPCGGGGCCDGLVCLNNVCAAPPG